jgi:hypothetical protein
MFTFTGILDTCVIFIHNHVKNNIMNVLSCLFKFETYNALNFAFIKLILSLLVLEIELNFTNVMRIVYNQNRLV